jgi:hypothetical protein
MDQEVAIDASHRILGLEQRLCSICLRLLDLGSDGLAFERQLLGKRFVARVECLLGLFKVLRSLLDVCRHLVLVKVVVLVYTMLQSERASDRQRGLRAEPHRDHHGSSTQHAQHSNTCVSLIFALSFLTLTVALLLDLRKSRSDHAFGGSNLRLGSDDGDELILVGRLRYLNLDTGLLTKRPDRGTATADHQLVLILGNKHHIGLGTFTQHASSSSRHW